MESLFGTGTASPDRQRNGTTTSTSAQVQQQAGGAAPSWKLLRRLVRLARSAAASWWLVGWQLQAWRTCIVCATLFTLVVLPMQLAFAAPTTGLVPWTPRAGASERAPLGAVCPGLVYLILDLLLLLDIAFAFKTPVCTPWSSIEHTRHP
jgi:hypothetical protein